MGEGVLLGEKSYTEVRSPKGRAAPGQALARLGLGGRGGHGQQARAPMLPGGVTRVGILEVVMKGGRMKNGEDEGI